MWTSSISNLPCKRSYLPFLSPSFSFFLLPSKALARIPRNLRFQVPFDYGSHWFVGEEMPWDLIHLRGSLGSVSNWTKLYKNIFRYELLQGTCPGHKELIFLAIDKGGWNLMVSWSWLRSTWSPIGIMARQFHRTIHSSDGLIPCSTQPPRRAGRSGGDMTLCTCSGRRGS